MKPATYYTKSGSINIAYQLIGSGPSDMVYIPGWVSNIDLIWACPSLAEFLQEVGKICRVILFDKRGTGFSDRISELSTLEERMDDIRSSTSMRWPFQMEILLDFLTVQSMIPILSR